jgi:hypothetical protein
MSKETSDKGSKTHVIKRDDGWAVKGEGASKARKVYDTKERAIYESSRLLKPGDELVIHKKNGAIDSIKSKK